MLITKFKNKYGKGDNKVLSEYIDGEVKRFLKDGNLTEDNLKSLDQRIQLELAAKTLRSPTQPT
jgi:hypothetical protein